ncbi:MAG: hypothetical protein LBD41_03195 [Clostridiales Family XIII bacterium]|jgi:hypothetical protein|nr:hypothetical protein [Clostridiales Family XIII bacterium]
MKEIDIYERLNIRALQDRLSSYSKKNIDFDRVADKVNYLRGTKDYETMTDYLIEVTSSCEPNEALMWMHKYMIDAVHQGKGEVDEFLRVQFLAAYDLYQEISGRYLIT